MIQNNPTNFPKKQLGEIPKDWKETKGEKLFPIPKGWVWTKVFNLVGKSGEIKDGDWILSRDLSTGRNVRLIQLGDIGVGCFLNKSNKFISKKRANELNCTLLRPGDILISRMAHPIARACILPNLGYDNITAVDITILRLDFEICYNRFICWLFNSDFVRRQAEKLSSGTTRKRISRKKLEKLDIPLPPLPDQHRIVAKIEELFSNLNAGVEALKKIKKQLKYYRQVVLKYAFEGKLTADWRQRMLNDKLRIFNEKDDLSRFKIDNSKLKDFPELPERWVGTRIGKLVLFEYGKGLPKRKREKGSVPVYGSNGIVGYHSKSLVKGPCIIVGRKGTAGMVHLSKEDCWPIDTTYYVIPPVGTDIYFLYYLLYVLNLGSLDKSTAIPGLNRNDAYNIKIPLPPLPEQHKIVEEIERRFSIADEVEKVVNKSLKQAERLRQSILKKAFEGKLVPQDPSDPPAIKLLERIKVEKAKLETELRNKRKKKT